ncbi:MAG TPA: TolC family protein [Terriglobia bacterium]|nr:TolC family protein [Terriglobia bacterium]
MKVTKIVICALLILSFAAPAMAYSDSVEEFLRRYDPSKSEPARPGQSAADLAQLLQTGVVPITMNDVVNMLMENNLDVRTNRMNPRSSYLQSLVFYKALQPAITFSGLVGRNTILSTTQLNGATASSQLSGSYSAGFSQLLPTGTSLAVTATMNRLSSNSILSTFNPSYTGRIVYSVGQHLLQNRGRLVNTYQILEGMNSEKISESQFETQLMTLVQTAQKAYWDLTFANEDLNVKRRALGLTQRTLDENKLKVEIGTLAPIDLVQTEAEMATWCDQIVISDSNVTTTEDQIKKLTSSDKDPTMFLVRFRPADSPVGPNQVQIPALEDAVRIALENRPEIRQAMLDRDNKDIDIQYRKNQKLPVFDVTASYVQNGTGGVQTVRGNVLGASQVLNVIPGGIANALQQLFGYGYTGYNVGFSVTIPLNNKAADADLSRALNDRQISQNRLDVVIQQVALDVRNALTQVQMNRSRIDTTEAALKLARQKLDAEQQKFELGTSTLRFVLEEQQNVAQAETNELQTVVNFNKSLVDLDKATGMTLKKNNIEFEKALSPVAANSKKSSEIAAR